MLSNRVLELTIPLFPYLQQGKSELYPGSRIRPQDALDLHTLVAELKSSAVATLIVDGHPWAVVSVYSPYTTDVHVMVTEMSPDRYLPAPERIPDTEGDALMELWASVLDQISQRPGIEKVCAGYNWSPKSWGSMEEVTGFQSIPTKWHSMLWGWPSFHQNGVDLHVRWIDAASLTLPQRRLLGENQFMHLLSGWIKGRLEETFPEGTLFVELFPHWDWNRDGRGLSVRFQHPVQDLLRMPGFFSQVLKPVDVLLETAFRDLTEIMTDMDWNYLDTILRKIEKGLLTQDEIGRLRTTPSLRDNEERRFLAQERHVPDALLTILDDPVRRRCLEQGDRDDWWRKGFGYALTLSSVDENSGELRIMPGVYSGPGGVVESMGILLKRPEDLDTSWEIIQRKSKILWDLADTLREQFRETLS